MIARQLTLLALLALTLLGFTLMVGYQAAPEPGMGKQPSSKIGKAADQGAFPLCKRGSEGDLTACA